MNTVYVGILSLCIAVVCAWLGQVSLLSSLNATSRAGDGTDLVPPTNDKDENSRFHFVYSVECNTYMAWQTLVLEHSFVTSRQRGVLWRLLACNPDDPDILEGVDLVSRSVRHPQFARDIPGDHYPPLNKPKGIAYWLKEHADSFPHDAVIVILDADMVFTSRLPALNTDLLRSRPIAAEYFYMAVRGIPALVTDYVPRSSIDVAQPVGVPVIIHHRDLAMIAHDWVDLTVTLRANATVREATRDKGWTAEMYAYSFAAARGRLRHRVRTDLMAYPPDGYTETPPWVLHYGTGFNFPGGHFDKHNHFHVDTNPLSCDTDWMGYSIDPALLAMTTSDIGANNIEQSSSECFTQRGRAGAAFTMKVIHEAIRNFRLTHLQCRVDPREQLPGSDYEVLSYPSYWQLIDTQLQCPRDYIFQYRGKPLRIPVNKKKSHNILPELRDTQRTSPEDRDAPELATTSRETMDDAVRDARLPEYPTPIRSASDEDRVRAVWDDVLTDTECLSLIDLLDRSFVHGKGFPGHDISAVGSRLLNMTKPGQVVLFTDIHDRILTIAHEQFGGRNLHFDWTHATRRHAAKVFHPRRGHLIHSDQCFNHPNGTCIASDEHCCAWREVSAVLLLNEPASRFRAYEGSTFTFVSNPVGDHALRVPGRCGRLVVFTSGPENLHGVTPVRKGLRYAIASWFTTRDNVTDLEYEWLTERYKLQAD